MTSVFAVLSYASHDPRRLADFWCQVLGYVVVDEDEDEVISIGPPSPPTDNEHRVPGIDFIRVPDDKVVKNRLHIDLRADGSAQHAELERLLSLGARRVDVGQGPDVSWVVLADPEGNEFCLLGRSAQDVPFG